MKEYEVPLTFHQYRPMLRVSDEENQTLLFSVKVESTAARLMRNVCCVDRIRKMITFELSDEIRK